MLLRTRLRLLPSRAQKIRGEEAPYSRPKIEQLRGAYRGAISHITLRARGDAEVKLVKKVIAAQLSMLKYPEPAAWSNPINFQGYTGGMVGRARFPFHSIIIARAITVCAIVLALFFEYLGHIYHIFEKWM